MTYQAGDRIRYEGGEYELTTLPLDSLPTEVGSIPGNLIEPSTDCWRGYVAHWEVADYRLWLVGIDAEQYLEDGTSRRLGLADIIPGATSRLVASWFSGTLSVPQGPAIPDGDDWDWMLPARYERTHELTVEHGLVVRVRVQTAADGVPRIV